MRQPKVTKEYKEDLGERETEGLFDYAYTYEEYGFTSAIAGTERASTPTSRGSPPLSGS
jgi:hypothetical protein